MAETATSHDTAYRVLARKYRPRNFDDLVGQEVLVRTLSNAFSANRIAHAFLLTGIRGIGKTTTARIIARGLNCIGPDGNGGPTTSPCGECPNCKMILEDRHVDVIEMDAASRTGVENIRDLIETVQYAPTNARYKVYIIDEVHMLSTAAFNALLKTLEEPPAHVKFIFATTELHKIPVTIVSRCQRFDLKRLNTEMMTEHLSNVAAKEEIALDEECAKLVATAAEGSVRDGLSLLDQAIALGADAQGKVTLSADAVRGMLGLADSTNGFVMLEHLYAGRAKEALTLLDEMYQNGADVVRLLQELLTLTHYMTRIGLDKALAENATYSAEEQAHATRLASELGMAQLARGWQMLLKGISEVKAAPHPLAAAEMILMRIAFAANMPSPATLVEELKKKPSASLAPSTSPAKAATVTAHASAPQNAHYAPPASTPAAPVAGNLALAVQHEAPQEQDAPALFAQPEEEIERAPEPETFKELADLFATHKEMVLYGQLQHDVRLAAFEGREVTLFPVNHVAPDMPARLGRYLSEWTGKSWKVRLDASASPIEATLEEQAKAERAKLIEYAKSTPLIHATLEAFPGAELIDIEKK